MKESKIAQKAHELGYEWVWDGQTGPEYAAELSDVMQELENGGEDYDVREEDGLIIGTRGLVTVYYGSDEAHERALEVEREEREASTETMKRMIIQVPADMHYQVRDMAYREHTSQTEIVKRTLTEYMA